MSWAKLAAILLGSAVLATSWWFSYELGQAHMKAVWDQATLSKKQGEEAALAAAAKAIARIEVKSEKHIQPLLTEIRTNTVYRDCVHSPDSLRHLNALIVGEDDAEPGGSGLPAADQAR